MKKSIKKALSLALALTVALSALSPLAFAADRGQDSCEECAATESACIRHIFQKVYYGSYIDPDGNTVHLYQYTCTKCGYSYIA